jgi:phage terminase large subunit-like protein
MAEACGPWFFPIVETIFGSLDVANNLRMIQEFFLEIPKKNSKSTGGAAIMVTAIIVNRRPNAEMILVAPTKEVAEISYMQASNMIRADPALHKVFHLQRHLKQITHRLTDATLKIKAADTDVITGGKAVVTLIDETHVFAKSAKASHVFLELRGALTSRPDGFLMQITTQSKEQPSGVFRSELMKARAVRDGRMQLPLLPILYELPERIQKSGEWKQRKFWQLVNPNLGLSVEPAFLERELKTAEQAGAPELALFASQHFDVEIGIGLSTDRWLGADFWLSTADKTLTLDEILRRSDVVVVGIDGGGLDDLLGLAVLGREKDTRKWLLWTHAWCHPKVLELRQEIAPKLLDLQKVGELTIVDYVGQDVTEVVDIIEKIEAEGLLPDKGAIGVDPVGIVDIIDELEIREFDVSQEGGRVVGIPQGWTLSNTIKTTERRLAGGDMIHADQELMNWCSGNAKVEPRGNAITITKQTSGTAKIDPLMATLNTAALMSKNPEPREIYADAREIRFL